MILIYTVNSMHIYTLDAKKRARSSTIMRDAPMQNTTKLLPNRRVNKLKIIGKLWGKCKDQDRLGQNWNYYLDTFVVNSQSTWWRNILKVSYVVSFLKFGKIIVFEILS